MTMAITRPAAEKARTVCVIAAMAASAAALLLLACPESPRCSAAVWSTPKKRFWGCGASVAPEASAAGTRAGAVARECDSFEGEWVWDDNYPLYESRDCQLLDGAVRCTENGRPDTSYTKWRWQPSCCDLPRFDAKRMLERLRNKRVVFVGDSLGRNQWESLLCMLSAGVSNKSSIYEINGSPVTKHQGFMIFKFRDYNCTVEYYRSHFLVPQGHAPAGAPKFVNSTVRVDVMDWMSDSKRGKWNDADLLIFNSGHWWTNAKTIGSGNYFQEGDELKLDMTIGDAYRRSIQTLFNWLHKEVNTNKTHVIFRTYSPSHFIGGGWHDGGRCVFENRPSMKPLKSLEQWADMLKPVDNILGNNHMPKLAGLDILNVTRMTAHRKDGHLSVFASPVFPNRTWHGEDCSHWCLPGIPDAWNELLYAVFMKKQMMLDPK